MTLYSPAMLLVFVAAMLLAPATALAQPPARSPALATPQAEGKKPAGDEKSVEKTSEDEDDKAGKKEPLTDKQKFVAALDRLEQQIVTRERYGKYGNAAVEGYAKELEDEYFANQKTLEQLSATGSGGDASKGTKIDSRQQHLSMLLWQLQRVGSQLGQPKNNGSSLTTDIHKLLSEHRSVMSDQKLMQRFHDLSRRASTLTRIRFSSRAASGFHFVRPTSRSVGSPASSQPGNPEPADKADLDGVAAKFEIGPIQTFRGPIGNLVGLGWKDGMLVWDEAHWSAPFAGFTLEDIDEKINAELTIRDVKLPPEDRLATFRKQRLFETPKSILLFQDLHHVASGGKPVRQSSSTSGTTHESRFSANDIEGGIKVSDKKLEFTIREDSGPSRRLLVRRGSDNELRISLIGKHISLLEQQADGSVRWVDIGEDVTAIKAQSFAELYAKHADRIESELFSRLLHCGIQPPMTRYDPQLVARILDRIRGVDKETKALFDELTTKIDSGSFGERQKAYRELNQDASKFSLLLAETSEDDSRSPEASLRLAELRKKSSKQFLELDTLITKTQWLTDRNYLLGLVKVVDDQHADLVNEQLKQLPKTSKKVSTETAE